MEDNEDDKDLYIFKIMLIGDSSVGKDLLISKFCEAKFDEIGKATVGIDTKTKFIKRDNKKIELQIWDTAGQERFKTLAKNCTNYMDGIVLVYDIGNLQSFRSIKIWYKNLLETVDFSKVGIILVGNKNDNEIREVNESDVEIFCEQNHLPFIESCAKTNKNVNEIFIFLIDFMLKLNNKKASSKRNTFIIDNSQKEEELKKKKKKIKCQK